MDREWKGFENAGVVLGTGTEKGHFGPRDTLFTLLCNLIMKKTCKKD